MSSGKIATLLFVGPTGAGKTPLGSLIEQKGLHGHPVAHFDFGDSLRAYADGSLPVPELPAAVRTTVQGILASNALLTADQFYIAAAILRGFAGKRLQDGNGVLLLNGLPRHLQQATALESTVTMKAVIELVCPPETVIARIAGNTGGDRAVRSDDTLPEITRKLEIYESRTRPLVDHYRNRGVLTVPVAVSATDRPMDTYNALLADAALKDLMNA